MLSMNALWVDIEQAEQFFSEQCLYKTPLCRFGYMLLAYHEFWIWLLRFWSGVGLKNTLNPSLTNRTSLMKRCGKGPNDTPILGKETVNSRKVSVANSFLHNCFAALHSAPAQHANHCCSAPQTILSFIINAFHSMPCIWLSSLSKPYL